MKHLDKKRHKNFMAPFHSTSDPTISHSSTIAIPHSIPPLTPPFHTPFFSTSDPTISHSSTPTTPLFYSTSDLVIFPVDESEFELVFSWVDGQDPSLAVPVQAIHTAAPHHGDVDREIQGADNTIVTKFQKQQRQGKINSNFVKGSFCLIFKFFFLGGGNNIHMKKRGGKFFFGCVWGLTHPT